MRIGIIGGGASGLMAAITAAGKGNAVTLYERQARVGRKLLATGNGRCNLTNEKLSLGMYHGGEPDFVRPALEAFPVSAALDFFHGLGLLTVTEPTGRVYPLSDQAGSVVDVLRFAAEASGAELRAGAEVTALRRSKSGFLVETAEDRQSFDRVIVCCGGLAGEKLGGTKSGYELLASLGHSRTKLYPALVQLKTSSELVRSLKGVRADGKVTLCKGKDCLAESAGEIQFTDYGVSGPAAFEVSRAASTGGEGLTVHIDLLRDYPEETVGRMLLSRCEAFPNLTAENLWTGLLHNRLGRTVLKAADYAQTLPLSELTEKDIRRIAAKAKDFALPISGTRGFDDAQVTCGGMDTKEFDPRTMESRLVPGLYAAGEVLDVDGDCGGCNLQWAWASGHLAGSME